MTSQPNKGKGVWEEDNDGEGESPGVWEEAVRRLREKDAAERERKEKEAEEAKREEEYRMMQEHRMWEYREKKKREEAAAERQRKAEESWMRSLQVMNAKKERDNRLQFERLANEARRIREERAEEEEMKKSMESRVFFDSVVQLARDLREKEEVEVEARKRKAKGKGPCSTQ